MNCLKEAATPEREKGFNFGKVGDCGQKQQDQIGYLSGK